MHIYIYIYIYIYMYILICVIPSRTINKISNSASQIAFHLQVNTRNF